MEPRPKQLTGARGGGDRGFVLILVLALLVLVTGLVVAFFITVTNENKVSQTYSNESGADILEQSAINLAEGQIVQATSSRLNTGDGNAPYTWASQPGMIRTYDSTGAANNCYKLYSSRNMVTTAANVTAETGSDVPINWNTEPALYTDLNAPVVDASGNLNFPIIDGTFQTVTINGASCFTYASGTTPEIEGFDIPVASVPTYNAGQPTGPANNPAPMPVQWLYVLKDGSISAPDAPAPGVSGNTATWNASTNPPTAANPIVGRIAFWTDDETSKLNINTAAEGTPYAFPHTNTNTDLGPSSKTFGFAISPPAAGEYNRYPGHPATTCLSVALNNWFDPNGASGATAPTAYSNKINDSIYINNLKNYFLPLTPRYDYGGSEAGTVPATTGTTGSNNASFQPIPPGGFPKDNRLFASMDESLFAPARTVYPELSSTAVQRLRFFLTANSRAPEVTPFNTPKVSMWPQWFQLGTRNAAAGAWAAPGLKTIESLLAYCSSFGTTGSSASGKNEYFIQRYQDSPSDTTGVIGWRGGHLDWDNVPRNQQLANYLYQLGAHPIPGYGASLVSKYTKTSYSSVVLQSIDMIRGIIDWPDYETVDGTMTSAQYGVGLNTAYGANYHWIDPMVMSGTAPNVLPTTTGTTALKGFGTHPVVTQIALGAVLTSATTAAPFLAFQLNFPAQAYPITENSLGVTATNCQNLGLTGTATTISTGLGELYNHYNTTGSPVRVCTWPLPVPPIQLQPGQTTIQLGGGGPVTFTFWDNFPNSNTVNSALFTVNATFPPVSVPLPMATAGVPGDGGGSEPQNVFMSGTNMVVRAVECGATSPLRGDWRLLGCIDNADQSFFEPCNPSTPIDYTNRNYFQVDSLRIYAGGDAIYDTAGTYRCQPICVDTGSNTQTSGTLPFVSGSGTPTVYLAGSLVAGMKNTDYEDFTAPLVPVGLTAALQNPRNGETTGRPGDWDTGPALMPDGPYINPVEEWNSAGASEYYAQLPISGSATNFGANGTASTVFTPNRIIASPVRFGSLATGADPANPQPWQTLLFCPNPAARTTPAGLAPTSTDHPGFGNPPDSAYLEFFTMPVVEPYAISEPLSTAGKVNLNYQLEPFTNIERSTALRGVLKSVMLSAIAPADANPGQGNNLHPTPVNGPVKYKFHQDPTMAARYADETHYSINRDATIAGIEEHYFNQGTLFRYPSEICGVFLVPQQITGAAYADPTPSTSYDNMMSWWQQMPLTGDNLREEPYDRIYPRVCTKSNTYTVHCRVQALRKAPGSNPAVWQEGTDQVASEYRGSAVVERYVDPGDPRLNAAWDANTMALSLSGSASDGSGPVGITTHWGADLSAYYKLHVLNTKKFAP